MCNESRPFVSSQTAEDRFRSKTTARAADTEAQQQEFQAAQLLIIRSQQHVDTLLWSLSLPASVYNTFPQMCEHVGNYGEVVVIKPEELLKSDIRTQAFIAVRSLGSIFVCCCSPGQDFVTWWAKSNINNTGHPGSPDFVAAVEVSAKI